MQLILQIEKVRGSERLKEMLKVTWPQTGVLGAQRLGNFLQARPPWVDNQGPGYVTARKGVQPDGCYWPFSPS